ncbi:hypothetical protein ACOME3_003848 [Neoechinorhynchus agilis]
MELLRTRHWILQFMEIDITKNTTRNRTSNIKNKTYASIGSNGGIGVKTVRTRCQHVAFLRRPLHANMEDVKDSIEATIKDVRVSGYNQDPNICPIIQEKAIDLVSNKTTLQPLNEEDLCRKISEKVIREVTRRLTTLFKNLTNQLPQQIQQPITLATSANATNLTPPAIIQPGGYSSRGKRSKYKIQRSGK